jgi:hypothetical protein
MNELQKELNELKEFIAELKADRAEAKAKEKRESWTRFVSLSVVIIAVIAAIASQRAGKYSGCTQMSQAQASDQWAFYQAKSIKQNLYEINRSQLHRTGNPNDPEVAREEKKYEETVARYEKEKAEIKDKATSLEKTRDDAGVRGGRMGLAVSMFSVSIAMASICLVTKKKPLWFASLLMAAAGLWQMALAWLS